MSTCNRLDLQKLGSQPVMPKNIPDHCSTLVTCHFILFGHFTKTCCAKVSTLHNEGLSKGCHVGRTDPYTRPVLDACTLASKEPVYALFCANSKVACHKIQGLQFPNKNVAGLRSWHSSKHFQNPTTPIITQCYSYLVRM